jgi:hypothetical protein
MPKVYCKKIDLENLDLNEVYTFKEFEYINDQLKNRALEINAKPINLFKFDHGTLIPMPQARGSCLRNVRHLTGISILTKIDSLLRRNVALI